MLANKHALKLLILPIVIGGILGIIWGGYNSEAGIEEHLNYIERELALSSGELRPKDESLDKICLNIANNPEADIYQRSRAHKALGDNLFLAGQYRDACLKYREALRWNPNCDEARNNLSAAMDRLSEEKNPHKEKNSQSSRSQNLPSGEIPKSNSGSGKKGEQNNSKQKKSPNSPSTVPQDDGRSTRSWAGDSNNLPNPDLEEDKRILRHLIERERDLGRPRLDKRKLSPPRGTENW